MKENSVTKKSFSISFFLILAFISLGAWSDELACFRLLQTRIDSLIATIKLSEPNVSVLKLSSIGRVILLVGPHGSGKTHSLQKIPSVFLSFPGGDFDWREVQPFLATNLRKEGNELTVVIDELERQPDLDNLVTSVLGEAEFIVPVDEFHPFDKIAVDASKIIYLLVSPIHFNVESGEQVVPHDVWSNRSTAIAALRQALIPESMITRIGAIVSFPTIHRLR